jgi:hypothetical protein
VIFNEGQPGRDGVIAGTLGAPTTIPALGTTYALGADTVQRIRNGQTVTFHIVTHTISEVRTTYNVLADSPGGDPNRTVVVSAHNDSVPAGPGINDDGTGVAMDLELAKYLGPRAPRRAGRRGRHRAQARQPVLVSAHPRAGLRVRPAVVDAPQDPKARARRRRALAQGPGPCRRRPAQQADP